jgi:hypothetical protein
MEAQTFTFATRRRCVSEGKSAEQEYATLPLGRASPQGLSAEKDFAYLDGSDQDNRDMFTDPMKDKVC